MKSPSEEISLTEIKDSSIETISSDIEYFSQGFIFISYITDKELIVSELQTNIKEFIPIIKSKNKEIRQETMYFLAQALSECVYKESSLIGRYILEKEFHVLDYSNKQDHEIIKSDMDVIFIPNNVRFFSSEDSQNVPLKSTKEGFKGIKDNNNNKTKTLKPLGNFFQDFNATYEFDKEIGLSLFNKIVSQTNKITKFDMLMLTFPKYYEILYDTVHNIFHDDKCYLPVSERCYYAIMAISTIGCGFGLKDMIQGYLLNGGDPAWITGGGAETPNKIKKIGKINNILAHQPWELEDYYIIESGYSEDLGTFTQICTILTTFHKLSAIYKVLHIGESTQNFERFIDIKTGTSRKIMDEVDQIDKSKTTIEREETLNYLKSVREKDVDSIKTFKNPYVKYTSDYCTGYKEYNMSANKKIFISDYCFQSKGFYEIKDYWLSVLKDIKEDYEYIYSKIITYKFGEQDDITEENSEFFRWKIVTSIGGLYGIFDDCFSYATMNKGYPIKLKYNLRWVVGHPVIAKLQDILELEFNFQEILHFILLVTSRKQDAQLTHMTQVIEEIRKNNDE